MQGCWSEHTRFSQNESPGPEIVLRPGAFYISILIYRMQGLDNTRFFGSFCPWPAAGLRQYNQHEVDYKRAANTLF